MKQLCLLVVIALLLSGCGGGGSSFVTHPKPAGGGSGTGGGTGGGSGTNNHHARVRGGQEGFTGTDPVRVYGAISRQLSEAVTERDRVSSCFSRSEALWAFKVEQRCRCG